MKIDQAVIRVIGLGATEGSCACILTNKKGKASRACEYCKGKGKIVLCDQCGGLGLYKGDRCGKCGGCGVDKLAALAPEPRKPDVDEPQQPGHWE